jgi:hypothetical protein
MNLSNQLRALPLFVTSFFEIAVLFARTFVMAHLLVPYEFGFASALAATNATFSQITDIALSSFVFSSPRSVYADAIAGAHAIAIVRGFCVGGFMLLASKPVACMFGACGDWSSFAWLAPVVIVNSFEHLEIRVAAIRDYRYWPTLVASIASNGCGLVALSLIAYKFQSRYGFIAFLLVQSFIAVAASHLLASNNYSVSYRAPFVRKALSFGLPLLLNGIGLAIMSQGDRWVVGGLMGLPFLGIYAVVTLAAFVPLFGLFKILGQILFAGIHHANVENGEYDARLKLFCRGVPAIAAVYALGLLGFYGLLVPVVFGHQYAISDAAIVLLSLIVFVRIMRTDPQTCLLFHTQNTRKLAIVGQVPFIGLLVTAGLVIVHPTLEFILVGILVGEVAGLCAIEYVSRRLLRSAIYDHISSGLAMLSIVLATGILILLTQSNNAFVPRIAIVGAFLILVLAYAGFSFPGLYKKAYRGPK